jgi:hypothetical protein
MVKVHATRLMRGGEVALWRNGQIVWSGNVGAALKDISFDAISIHIEDAAKLVGPDDVTTPQSVLQTLAEWWN